MVNIEPDLKYTNTHEWVRADDGVATIGMSDYAQNELGDITYLELPEPGTEVSQGEPLGVVESVKAASDIYAPVSGEVVARNEEAVNSPDLVNKSPYEEAWLIKVQMTNPEQLNELMDANAYETFAASETH